MRWLLIFVLLFSHVALAADDTLLVFYRPFGNEEQQPIITTHLNGVCLQQSQRIKREDAWRCQAEGKTYDPCFIKQYSDHKQAVCPASPWNNNSVQIDMPYSVDNSQHPTLNMSEAYPWAVQLNTGEKCQAIDEGRVYEDMAVHYQCETESLLLGHLQRCKSQWSILQQTANGEIDTVMIDKAWF